MAISGPVRTLALQPNGRVLLGGDFTTASIPSGVRANLARVLDNGQFDASFGATATPNVAVRSIVVQPDGAIAFAGEFSTVAGQPRLNVARITAPNVLSVAAPAAVAARTAAWPVPAHGQLRIAPDLSAGPLAVELTDALGRTVRRQPATRAAEQTLDLETLPAGLYVLRVHYAAGTVARRIAVE
ncbi:T9SS type A sorting domain-containing protein [Hymenobacter sp. BT662]|uniref:T9SS type A sorting domain-containing protein n=1 Tax=Hymenobacter ruricola TaxID=2791023 RepID=A0ABS0IBG8_9BACT|nr:T9SS type A sorting domain-containing protein [Hymenobacter ruricola]